MLHAMIGRSDGVAKGRGGVRTRARDLVPALALTLVSVVAVATAALSPAAGAPVAAVFAPGTSAEDALRAVAAADGAAVRSGGFDNVVVAVSADPEFHHRLRRAGAWLLLDPKALAACAPFAG